MRKLNVETKKYSCAVKQKDKSITAIRKELNTAASRFRKQEMSLKKEMDRLQKRNDALQRALNLSRGETQWEVQSSSQRRSRPDGSS